MKDVDGLLRDFVDLADRPQTSRYLEQLALADATAERMAALLGQLEQKVQRLEAVQGPLPRAIAREVLALTRATGKSRVTDPGPLAGWKKVASHGEPVPLASETWSAAIDHGHRLMWTVNTDRIGDEPHPCRKVSWRTALDTLAKLNYHAWCGHRDWRIPGIGELATLAYTEDDSGTYRISGILFPDVGGDAVYWSSTRFEDTRLLQALAFGDASRVARQPGANSYLRFVRTVTDDEI